MIVGLSLFYKTSSDNLSTQQFKDYLHYRIQQEHVSPSTINQCIGAWRLLQVDILKRDWEEFKIKRPKTEKKLPVVLSRQEALRLINAPSNHCDIPACHKYRHCTYPGFSYLRI